MPDIPRSWCSSRVGTTLGRAPVPALGLIEAGTFGTHTLTLAPGTLVVAYTDGVSEARNDADDEFGDDAADGDSATAAAIAGAVEVCAARARRGPPVSRRRARIRTT